MGRSSCYDNLSRRCDNTRTTTGSALMALTSAYNGGSFRATLPFGSVVTASTGTMLGIAGLSLTSTRSGKTVCAEGDVDIKVACRSSVVELELSSSENSLGVFLLSRERCCACKICIFLLDFGGMVAR